MIYIKYQLQCTCGKIYALEAENYETAFSQMKSIVSLERVKSHYEQEKKHKGDTVPTPEQLVAMVSQHLKEVTEEPKEPKAPEAPVAEEEKPATVQA